MALTHWERKRILAEKHGVGAAAAIARSTGRSASHVAQVLNCEKYARRDIVVERAAARIAKMPIHELFPPMPTTGSAA